MTFDLYFFPTPAPPSVEAVYELMEAAEEADGVTGIAIGPQIAGFVAELEQRWPGEDDEDFDESPWSSWPLMAPEAWGGIGLNVRWSRAEDMLPALIEIAGRHGVTVFDPQTEALHPPPA